MLKKINKDTCLMLVLIIFETIAIKCLLFQIFPEKYFFDSIHILNVMNGIGNYDKAYLATASFYNFFNIFNLVNTIEWSYVLGLIFSFVFILLIDKNEKYTLKKQIIIYTFVGLLNIYVFCLSKDLIQFLIFVIAYMVYKSKKIDNIIKLCIISAIFLIEAYFFRIHYALFVIFLISNYVIYQLFIKNKKITRYTIFKFIIFALIIFIVEMFALKIISYNNYYTVAHVRYWVIETVENFGSESNSVTSIYDPLGENTNFIKFIFNYLIAFIRLLFPIELLLKGVKYIPFVILQLFLTLNIFRISKNLNKKNIILVDIIISYVILSAIFEPDFGSFIRHETTLTLLFIDLININDNNKLKKKVLNEKN